MNFIATRARRNRILPWLVLVCGILLSHKGHGQLLITQAPSASDLQTMLAGVALPAPYSDLHEINPRQFSPQPLLALTAPGDKPVYLNLLTPLYAVRDQHPMWQDAATRQEFLQQLSELALAGIQPQFARWITRLSDNQLSDQARDVLLSDALLGYLQFTAGVTSKGKNWLYNNKSYRLAVPPLALINQWQQAVYQGNTLAFIRSLAPANPHYLALRQSLRQLLTDPRPWPTLPDNARWRTGQQSAEIPAYCAILQRLGMLTAQSSAAETSTIKTPTIKTPAGDNPSPLANDDLCVTQLPDAIKRFQHWQGLTDDGIIGKHTRRWLAVTPAQRAALVALNIQRLRLLPGDIGTAIMVNIPAYSLRYYLDGQLTLQSRVIVGRPDRKTPIMTSVLNTVVVNPPWNVPASLARKDILPKVQQNPAYLARHGYTVLSDWRQNASVIDPDSVDWQAIAPEQLAFHFRQAPGAQNSLGRYKFNMPDSDEIYLHDTPDHRLFQRNARAVSSGCVRVGKAAELADMLLRDAGWSKQTISDTLQKGQTRAARVTQTIPVQLYYMTVFINTAGEIRYRDDIYQYDLSAQHTGKLANTVRNLLRL